MASDPLTQQYISDHPESCAVRTFTKRQVCWYLTLAGLGLVLLLYRWDIFLTVLNLVAAVFYFLMIAFRLLAVSRAWFRRPDKRGTHDELASIHDDDLPTYTILVPMYHESNIAQKLIKNLDALDYPPRKLDIKLLLEPDDVETRYQLDQLTLASYYEIVTAPHSHPQTKPKACNHGLAAAKGEYVVIFDAEDRPDPDQLRQAAWAFAHTPDNVACVQARLDYFNPRQNLLTRWFTIEYAAWFGLFLPGLQTMGVPIPLGGTSNHFRTETLRKLGGWDPYNVTEDCDLGIRLHKAGFRTIVIDSTTWEEANSQLGNWIRQRSRWVKGFLQTHLAHMRNPLKTVRELGLWGTTGFFMTVGGVPLLLLLNTVYWAITLVYMGLLSRDLAAGNDLWQVIAGPRDMHRHAWKMIYHGPNESSLWAWVSVVFFCVTMALLLSNLLIILINHAACRRRNYRHLVFAVLTSPIYWLMMSVAAWKGAIQLITRPSYWEKTEHGLTESDKH